jgi:hypothetical protein
VTASVDCITNPADCQSLRLTVNNLHLIIHPANAGSDALFND